MEAQPAAHPSEKTLSSYCSGLLDGAEVQAVDRHLKVCGVCRRSVAGMTTDRTRAEIAARPARPTSPPPVSSSLEISGQGTADFLTPPSASSLPQGLAEHPDYQVLCELGRGGMGVVYLAENKLMGRKEVLKVVGSHLLNRKGVAERFLREIRAASQLEHPNIVRAYSASRIGESIVLAMEYVEGSDLAKLVEKKGPLRVPHACNFVYQAALGLQHAHERGMVHRDIKPSNLMLSRDGNRPVVKILDLGLAKVTSEGTVDGGLTHEGQMLGTPHYISPEQTLNAQNADIRADIYSLGCTLYCLLTGHPPFDAPSLYELLQAHHSMDAPPLNLIRPDVPVDLAALVAKMMAKDPQDRFQTPAQVAQALAPFTRKGSHASAPPRGIRRVSVTGQGKGSSADEGRPSSTRPSSRLSAAVPAPPPPLARARVNRLYVGLVGGVVVAVGLVAAWTVARPNPGPRPTPSPAPAPVPPAPSTPEQPEDVLADAEAAIRSSNWPEAMERIDRYLANPQASDSDRASKMRLELLAATSEMEADLVARGLSDRELAENLEKEGRPMASRLEIQELSSAYRNNLLKALRREKVRRQARSEERLVQEQRPPGTKSSVPPPPRPVDSPLADASAPHPDQRASESLLRSERSRSLSPSTGSLVQPIVTEGRATIDDVLSFPEKYDRRALVLRGLFRIGTRVERVKVQSGQAVGFSLPVARDDGRTICAGDGKIVKSDMTLLIDSAVVGQLERVLAELNIRAVPRPAYRSILEVRMETLSGDEPASRTLVIRSLEILGACNFRHVLSGNLAEAFTVIDLTPASARVRYGDGTKWIELLGGEEKFVGPIRRRLREAQRIRAAEMRQAEFDKFFQKEMAVSMKMAEAQSRDMQAAVNRAMSGGGLAGFRR